MATSANPAMYARYTLLLAAATAVHAYQIGAGAGRSIVQRAIDMAAPAAAADFGLGALSRDSSELRRAVRELRAAEFSILVHSPLATCL